ncbi:hypothetical protein O181_020839 [Austropuccinia psidii MF-1]|uniref:Uncharacterized protein n=1 Tax=Austropuccinia psidii MF-1 TaxID=1389203 RepID=A0A9Q3C9N4_9BASI|nr:hypothetical protein [Austropuccinia psidii MF-1]
MISPVPSSINLSTPPPRPPSDGHFTPRPEQSDYLANEGWQWRENIQAWADLHHVMSPMGFKRRKPSPTKEPPIPGPSPSSQPPEGDMTHETEPEVAPTQSTEEPFARPATPCSIIIIDNTPVGSPLLLPLLLPGLAHLPILFPSLPSAPENPNTSSPRVKSPSHSHDDARQEFTDL